MLISKRIVLILIYFHSIKFYVSAQTKKDQIVILNRQIDSLNSLLNLERERHEYEVKNLSLRADQLSNQNSELEGIIDSLNFRTTKMQVEFDATCQKLAFCNERQEKFCFDTLIIRDNHTCYYYSSYAPHLISGPISDSLRKYINDQLSVLSLKVPAVMSNTSYRAFRECPPGDYDHKIRKNEQHAIISDCEWCQSEFDSSVEETQGGIYLSILMKVNYVAGGNWGHTGYNSFNFDLKKKRLVSIPSNPILKSKMIDELSSYLDSNPMIDDYGNNYPILEEIKQWEIVDLTFYFKNDVLRLKFANGDDGVYQKVLDAPLPGLQNHLKL